MPGQMVYLLWHEHELNGCDEVLFLGAITARELAEESQLHLEVQPGFSERRDGFTIEDIELNQRFWSEGFIIVS